MINKIQKIISKYAYSIKNTDFATSLKLMNIVRKIGE